MVLHEFRRFGDQPAEHDLIPPRDGRNPVSVASSRDLCPQKDIADRGQVLDFHLTEVFR